MRRALAINLDIIRSVADPELNAILDRAKPGLDKAVEDAITEYEKASSDRIERLTADLEDDSEIRAAMDKALADADNDIKETSATIDVLTTKIKEMQTAAEAIDAAAVSDHARQITALAEGLKKKVDGLHDKTRAGTRAAATAALKAVGL